MMLEVLSAVILGGDPPACHLSPTVTSAQVAEETPWVPVPGWSTFRYHALPCQSRTTAVEVHVRVQSQEDNHI